MYFRIIGALALCFIGLACAQNGATGDVDAAGSEVWINYNGTIPLSVGSYMDMGSGVLPSGQFAIEMRLVWRGQFFNSTTQTFFFYGTTSNYLWIGGVPGGNIVSSSPGNVYVVVKNSTGVYSSPVLVKTKRSETWFILSASFTKFTSFVSMTCWSINWFVDPPITGNFNLGFDPADAGTSGVIARIGSAPAAVQSEINAKVGGTGFIEFSGRIDEIRIFNTTRSGTDIAGDITSRISVEEPNLYALWTITEAAGSTTITDLISGRVATLLVGGAVGAQEGDVVVDQVYLLLPFYQNYTLPIYSLAPGQAGATGLLQTTTNDVDTCYSSTALPTCATFPITTYTDNYRGSVTFTPKRTSCGTTQVFGFVPDPVSGNTFSVTIKYTNYTLAVDPSTVTVGDTASSVVQITGTFGANYTATQTLDGTYEYVQFTGESNPAVSTLPSYVTPSGLFVTFPDGYGTGQITIKMCSQTVTRPIAYPQPIIASLAPFNGSIFNITGSYFGYSRSWAAGDVVFTTPNINGTLESVNCIVSSNADNVIVCSLVQNKAVIDANPVNITVNVGSYVARYYVASFDACGGSCLNGGKCVSAGTCDCTETFYEGANCEVKLQCFPACVHGNCTRDRNSTIPDAKVCSCEDGWEGQTCKSKISSGKSTPVALIAGVSAAGGVIILGLAAVVVVLLIRNKNQRRGGKNFIPLHKKDFTKIIYGEQLNQDVEKSDADLNKLELMLVEDNLEVAVAVSNITQITEADKIAKALVVVFQDHDKVLTLLQAFIAEEVNTTESAGTLFRSNSMVSKMFKFYSRLIGLPYLYETIGPELCELIEEELGLEVDPEKMEEGTDLDEMRWMLMAQSQKILKSILNNIERCPPQFRLLFAHIKRCVAERFPENVNTTIGGFIFLRFFCPAVSSPEAYGIVEEPPSASARRLLILITKVLQNLSNDVEFGSKEPYMTKMNDFIHSNRQKLSDFYDKLVKPSTKANVTCTLPKNMKAVSLSVVANHIKDNLAKVENPTVKSRLESIFS